MSNLNKETFKKEFLRKLTSLSVKSIDHATEWDVYNSLGVLTKEYLSELWLSTNDAYDSCSCKQIYYFSLEFLTGKFLINNLKSLGIYDVVKESICELGFDIEKVAEIEKDQGLGNGGLGRLAAGFMDSLAALALPGHGCGIRYNYGLFEQKIINGYQVEYPDKWLKDRNIWEIKKPELTVEVKFGGKVESYLENGDLMFDHKEFEIVKAVPYDTPIVGYKNNTINTLRLWSAESSSKDYNNVGIISQALYPNDSFEEGKILRLKQEYFFVSAGLQGIINNNKRKEKDLKKLSETIAIHINDTHPSLCIPELMRILIDENGMDWDSAWKVTVDTMAYTNHTIMSEALERWPIDMFKKLLPRIFMIVEEINNRFVQDLRDVYHIHDEDRINQMAIVGGGEVRMAYLAMVGSHSINGVAKLHTEILKKRELKNFYEIYPHKFNNKTNGISHRRWLLQANPNLTKLIGDSIGEDFKRDTMHLRNLLDLKQDKHFQKKIEEVKFQNKVKLAEYVKEENGITIDPYSIFDVHAKRIHEYKRQTLNILHIMYLYNELKENPNIDIPARTFIFAGKAAPNYIMAKTIIKLINTVADKINNDPLIRNKIKVVFLENYSVSLAEILIPAADVSEQISTASKEASGTGNMKFMMNGAITIGTMDGANVEILTEVGSDNIFIFGLVEADVYRFWETRTYSSKKVYDTDIRIKRVIDQLVDGTYDYNLEEFSIIHNELIKHNDNYFVLKDFESYLKAQNEVVNAYKNRSKWLEMAIANIACSGVFSSDHTIKGYSSNIWNIKRMPIEHEIDF